MASQPAPRYYVLHGEDELACSEALDNLKGRLGPPDLVALNVTVFDGDKVTLNELRNACDTIPFMAQRRMVIVHGLLSWLAATRDRKKGDRTRERYAESLANYLPRLPETTRLVFVETVHLDKDHPILQQAKQDATAYVRAFVPPKDLVGWTRRRAREQEGEFSPEAAVALVQAVGNDQRLLKQEIDKLLDYTNQERPVNSQDVALLVPYAQEAVIFDAVDAMGRRNGVVAVRLLHNLLEHGHEPLYLFAMIVRQFRLLIQIKELAETGLDASAISKAIKLHPFPTRKLYGQARNFTLDQLERIYRHLLEIDVQIKTGQMDIIVALDLLVAGIAPPE